MIRSLNQSMIHVVSGAVLNTGTVKPTTSSSSACTLINCSQSRGPTYAWVQSGIVGFSCNDVTAGIAGPNAVVECPINTHMDAICTPNSGNCVVSVVCNS